MVTTTVIGETENDSENKTKEKKMKSKLERNRGRREVTSRGANGDEN